MNGFESAVYVFLDAVVDSDAGLMVFLLGGYALSFICAMILCTPMYRGIPIRLLLVLGSAMPAVVAIYGSVLDLFVRGRHTGIVIALSPMLLAFIPTFIALIGKELRTHEKRTRTRVLLSCILLAQLWATLVTWLATNSGFMGASC